MVVEGKNKITLTDVVVGEVWVCSGQSNMEWTLNKCIGAPEDIAASANPLLRHFLVKKGTSTTPLESCEGQWVLASPETSGTFTAVGYYFGRVLQKELNQPVGLIHSSWGGTPSEAWTSSKALDSNPDLKASKDKMFDDLSTFPKRKEEYTAKFQTWMVENKREDHPAEDFSAFLTKDPVAAEWKPVKFPGDLKSAGLPDAGAVWVRKTITLDPNAAGQNLVVELANIRDFDTLYWNGEKVAETQSSSPSVVNRKYTVPGKLVTAGDNTIALRIFCPSGGAGITANNTPFKAGSVALAGEWQGKAEFELPALEAAALAAFPQRPTTPGGLQNTATCLFNAMIHPLLPYAIKGTIWYQGESNAGRAFQYRTAFPLMISDWRSHWNQGDFPFYFCQLANYQAKKDQPGESGWAELRDAQTSTLSLPNTGMAVLVDIGETNDIHPRNKKDVGGRLAAIALAKDYGKKIPFSGPMYESVKIDGNQAVIQFKNTDGGLKANPLPETQVLRSSANETAPLVKPVPNSQLQGFAICGEDKQWKWAEAKIEGETVVVSSPEVPQPIAVRYAWSDNPTCNLYNGAGLPASPFRTDDFPPSTLEKKF
jgi:sialate O-acetylesterase